MSKLALQPNTDQYVLIETKKRLVFLLTAITNQNEKFDVIKTVSAYYVKAAVDLKSPLTELGRSELLINTDNQIHALHSMFGLDDFDPTKHFNIKSNDISGHLVFSLNSSLNDMLLDETFEDVNFWGTNTLAPAKRQIILIALLLDALFLTTYYEYGSLGLEAVMHGRLTNTGQWWAWMELNKFSSSSYEHAGELLHTTKSSRGDASLNGASALFPTNMTYARFSGFVRNTHKELTAYNSLIGKFSNGDKNDFNLVITEKSKDIFSNILAQYRFHAVAVYTAKLHMFSNAYVGYINMWRYNNSVLRSHVK